MAACQDGLRWRPRSDCSFTREAQPISSSVMSVVEMTITIVCAPRYERIFAHVCSSIDATSSTRMYGAEL